MNNVSSWFYLIIMLKTVRKKCKRENCSKNNFKMNRLADEQFCSDNCFKTNFYFIIYHQYLCTYLILSAPSCLEFWRQFILNDTWEVIKNIPIRLSIYQKLDWTRNQLLVIHHYVFGVFFHSNFQNKSHVWKKKKKNLTGYYSVYLKVDLFFSV